MQEKKNLSLLKKGNIEQNNRKNILSVPTVDASFIGKWWEVAAIGNKVFPFTMSLVSATPQTELPMGSCVPVH